MRRLFAARTFGNLVCLLQQQPCRTVARPTQMCQLFVFVSSGKKELLRCDIATVSPRRSSAKNHVLEELHVVMNRICICTYVNVFFYILMFVFGFRVLFQAMLFFSLFFSDLG